MGPVICYVLFMTETLLWFCPQEPVMSTGQQNDIKEKDKKEYSDYLMLEESLMRSINQMQATAGQ